MARQITALEYKLFYSFPRKYILSVERIAPLLEHRNFWQYRPRISETVHVYDESIALIARQYADKKISISGLDFQEKAIMHCLYTRHHDGYVRQAHLQALLSDNFVPFTDMITPFVLQLLGEYVLEIGLDCDKFIQKYPNQIKDFVQQNPHFWFKQKQRIVSYWNEYHRHYYATFKDYPLYQTIDSIEKLLKNDRF